MNTKKRISTTIIIAVSLATAMAATNGPALAEELSATPDSANALIMPFDVSVDGSGRKSATELMVSNVGARQVTTHWAFYGDFPGEDRGTFPLFDVEMCLPAGGTLTVDPTAVSRIGRFSSAIGNPVDLSGRWGFVTVTAYSTSRGCAQAKQNTAARLVDRALIGSYSIVHRVSANSFSGEAVGLGVHPSGAWTELPEMGLEVSEVQTSSPEALATSLFFLLAVEEAAGQYPGEIGPSIGALIDVAPFFSDRFGVDTSLPKIRFSGLRMTSLRRGVAGVIPDFVSIAEPGVLRLDFRSPEALMGFDRWVYAFHLHRAGRFPKAVRGVETVTHCPFSAGCQ